MSTLQTLRTLWYLRPVQMRAQLRRALRRRLLGAADAPPVRLSAPSPRLRPGAPAAAFLGAPTHASSDGRTRVRLLHREVLFPGRIDWEHADEGPLWAYHLHQFDWARSAECAPTDRLGAIADWMARHRDGVGWSPQPTSSRVLSWLKLLTTPGALPAGERGEILASLADQLATLERRLELHLLGNHYLLNLLALVFGGLWLEGSRADAWLGHETRLRKQLVDQIADDGLHVERSPMYHAILLEALLDVVNASRSVPGRAPRGFEQACVHHAARMLGALEVLTHPDGEIALFGDSAFGIASPPGSLRAYAAELGIEPAPPLRSGVLDASGFARLEAGPFVVLMTASKPAPEYQPGHAHCDALSFELSVNGERVVTDTGVFEYQPGALRDLARATASHATAQVEGQEQSELWLAHRVGGRADAALVRAEAGAAEGVCAGWATPEVLHRRVFELTDEELRIHDRFDRPAAHAVLRLPLAPGLEPELRDGVARIGVAGGRRLVIDLPTGVDFSVESRPCFPEFGRRLERRCLRGEASALAEARFCMRLE